MDENEKRNPSLNVWELNLISYILKSRFNSIFGTDELNGPTIRVLYYMYRENIYSPIALAKYLSFSRATITGHLHILEKYGYIALKPDQKDLCAGEKCEDRQPDPDDGQADAQCGGYDGDRVGCAGGRRRRDHDRQFRAFFCGSRY